MPAPDEQVEASWASKWADSLPSTGWRGLVKTHYMAAVDFSHDNGTQWAAAIAYYGLLSAVPLLLVIGSIAAFFVDRRWAMDQAIDLLGEYIPRQGAAEIRSVVREAFREREQLGIVSFIAFLWTGSRVFSSITNALNIAYGVREIHTLLHRTLLELGMVVTIGIFFILAVTSRVLVHFFLDTLGVFLYGQEFLEALISELTSALLLYLAFALIYKFVPRQKVNWRSAFVGAFTATLLFVIVRPIFLTYVSRFANYGDIYGSLAAFMVLVVWSWIVGALLVYGGEVASHLQAIVIDRQPAEEVEKQHIERSPTAPAERPGDGDDIID